MTAGRARRSDPHVVQVVQAIDRGGLEMMAIDLAIAVHERGIRSTVLALSEGGRLEARLREAGVGFELVGGARFISPASHAAVARALRRARPTVLHTHHLPSLLNAGPFARLSRLARVVHTEHAFIYMDEEPRFRPLFRAASRMAHSVVLVGSALVPYYTGVVGVPEHRLSVIANGVDTRRFRPIDPAIVADRRDALGLPSRTLLAGAVGRLAPVKDYPLLLRAAAAARRAGIDVGVVLVGDGEERESLERLAGELGLVDHVWFMGWRTDVAAMVGLFDVLAVTSTSEALPLVILEAMSSAVPVVSTAVGEIPKVLEDGASGVLIPSGDVDALTAALTRLAADPATRRRIGARGRERIVRSYSLDAMVDAYLGLYGLGAFAAAAPG